MRFGLTFGGGILGAGASFHHGEGDTFLDDAPLLIHELALPRDDAAAAAMLRALAARLAPGGNLTLFQFAPHNPTRAYMEWIANWYLIYRSGDQLKSLVTAAGLAANRVTYGAEPLGVDLYVTIEADAKGQPGRQ